MRLEDETVWLSQEQMAILFGKARTTITEHIQNVFTEGELDKKVVCRNFRHATQHGAIAANRIEKRKIGISDFSAKSVIRNFRTTAANGKSISILSSFLAN